jgi:3,4-dihydroxyphenylacetate 2,3-dioxygenase
MGKLVYAAKVSHVPTMFLSEREGPFKDCRKDSVEGQRAMGREMAALGVDTAIVIDTHWLVNNAYHVNCSPRFKGNFTSNEFPHLLADHPYDYEGNPAAGELIASIATNEKGVQTFAHKLESLDLEYGTLMPMWLMNPDRRFKVVSIAGLCTVHSHARSRLVGEAIAEAIARSEGNFAILASGSLSHRIHDNDNVTQIEDFSTISDEFYRQVDLRAVELWKEGRFQEFTAMLPLYAKLCHGEGFMHDTAMLLGALGWDKYQGKVEAVTPYFAATGTGQVNARFPLPA